MDSNVEKLTKLAEELTDRVDALEKENAQLKAQAKQASVPVAAPAPVVSEKVASETCERLVKAGGITQEQVAQTKEAFLKDPEAVHRTLQVVLDGQTQVKQANASETIDLSGGRLVDGDALRKDAQADCLERMSQILEM